MFIYSYVRYGFEGILVRIEADLSRGIPGLDMTGLAAGAVREARERVRSSFRHSGFQFPHERVLINLAPAEVKKEDAALDLPVALTVLAASSQIPSVDNMMALGELELSGNIRSITGALAAAARARDEGINLMIVPAQNKREAEILFPGKVAGASNLSEAAEAVRYYAEHGGIIASRISASRIDGCDASIEENLGAAEKNNASVEGDFSEVRGQGRYKRALEIAAAGGHNALVFGPPGAGKTMLARRFCSIFPDLAGEDAVTLTRLFSLAGLLTGAGGKAHLMLRPPFRAPHHSSSAEGILGGGKHVRPGEASLAHGGVLFLDEAPQFHINVLQSLREPLEEKRIRISRAAGLVVFPADFQLLLSANPCPCGKLGARTNEDGADGCYCSSEEIYRYWRKFSGALLDRVELRLAVRTPDIASLQADNTEEKSETVRKRVTNAVNIQNERFKGSAVRRNAAMPPSFIEKYCALEKAGANALHLAVEKLRISGRAYHGILRVARTIADLEGKPSISVEHILEAVQHRRLGDDPYDVLAAE